MSASKTAVLSPKFDKAKAKFTAVVDFPTPPFPEAMPIIFLTPLICHFAGSEFSETVSTVFVKNGPWS